MLYGKERQSENIVLRGARVRRVPARIELDPTNNEYGMPPGATGL